jgi:hypothetical protein
MYFGPEENSPLLGDYNPDFGEFFTLLNSPDSEVFLRFSRKPVVSEVTEVDPEDAQFGDFMALCDGFDEDGVSLLPSLPLLSPFPFFPPSPSPSPFSLLSPFPFPLPRSPFFSLPPYPLPLLLP